MEGSVDSYINAQPEVVMSKKDYWAANNPGEMPYNSVGFNINKFFGSTKEKQFESEYENYLNNVNNRNEFLAQQSARAWDKMMDDTKYQRLMKDLDKAGLNPYLALNNGSISAGAAPASTKASYKADKQEEKKKDNTRNMALIMLALAKVAAAFL